MARNERTKTRAFKLLKEDVGHREIAEKLNVSLRTIQRWAKEIEPVPIKVLVEEFNDKTNEKIPPQNPLSNHQFDVTLSRRVAIRLLHLSETAIAAVEDTLSNPDTSTANKLKAAKIAGDWLGRRRKRDYVCRNFADTQGGTSFRHRIPPSALQ